jgi:hypothetical protein
MGPARRRSFATSKIFKNDARRLGRVEPGRGERYMHTPGQLILWRLRLASRGRLAAATPSAAPAIASRRLMRAAFEKWRGAPGWMKPWSCSVAFSRLSTLLGGVLGQPRADEVSSVARQGRSLDSTENTAAMTYSRYRGDEKGRADDCVGRDRTGEAADFRAARAARCRTDKTERSAQ